MFHRGAAILFGLLIISFSTTASAQNQLPLLDEYRFEFEDWNTAELLFLDPRLGQGGSAQLRLQIRPASNRQVELQIEVFRHVGNRIFFALLLERITITFTDATGQVLQEIILDESLGPDGLFIIGDSNDGYFRHRRLLSGVANARVLTVRTFGNYE